jgi:hypothetical protein
LINKKGGTASLWLIEVQEEFVGQSLRDAVSASRFHNPDVALGFVSPSSISLASGSSLPLQAVVFSDRDIVL